MNFVIGTTSLDATATDLLAVGVKQGELAQALQTLDAAFGNKLSEALTADEFDGKAGSGKAYPTFGHVAAKRILLVGIGDGSAADLYGYDAPLVSFRSAGPRIRESMYGGRLSVECDHGPKANCLVSAQSPGGHSGDHGAGGARHL